MEFKNTYKELLSNTKKSTRKNITVYTGLSGGVDSATTAYLLKKEGFNVTGIYMQCWGKNDPECKAHQDRADALKVANYLSIPFEVWDFEEEYKKRVIDYFFSEYKLGRTPNPDVICNKEIKFNLFLQEALKRKADYVSTGHYAQILLGIKPPFASKLFVASGTDTKKDQSYFLAKMPDDSLPKTLFPLGEFTKEEVRLLAKKEKIPVAEKKDSTGICFLEGVNVQEFLRTRIKEKEGVVKDLKGNILGTHKGVWFYTIGQRHGFKLKVYVGQPLYVVKKDIKNNVLYVGEQKDLLTKKIYIKNLKTKISLGALQKLVKDGVLYLRIRNLGEFYKISNLTKDLVTLEKAVSGVAPGQFGVFYYFSAQKYKVIVSSAKIT